MSLATAGQPPVPSGAGGSSQATALAQLLMGAGAGGVNQATGLPAMKPGEAGMVKPWDLATALSNAGLGGGGGYATKVPTAEEWTPQSSWWSPAQRQMTYTPQLGNTGGTGPALTPDNSQLMTPPGAGGGGGTGRHGWTNEGPITSTPTYPPEIVEAAGKLGVTPDKITPGLAHELGWNIVTPEQLAGMPQDTTSHGQQSNVPGQPGSATGGATFGPLAPAPGQDTSSIQGFNLDPAKAPGVDPGFATNFNYLMNKYGPAYAYDFAMKQTYGENGQALRSAMQASGIDPADISRVINQTNQQGQYFDFLNFGYQKPGGVSEGGGRSNEYDPSTNTYTVGGKYTGSGLTGGQQIKLPAKMGG